MFKERKRRKLVEKDKEWQEYCREREEEVAKIKRFFKKSPGKIVRKPKK